MPRSDTAYDLAKESLIKTGCLKPGEQVHSLIGGKFSFERNGHLIVGSIVSLGAEPDGTVSFRVSSPSYGGLEIVRIVPGASGEAVIECQNEAGQSLSTSGFFKIF